MDPNRRIAIFASGNGSNAQRIAEYFSGKDILEIAGIYCNNPTAYVLERARHLGLPSIVFTREEFRDTRKVLDDLQARQAGWIILAGFLWLIPDYLLEAYRGRIINIHPALLPRFGGKGMYGLRVHEAVLAAGEKESGITIHQVNDRYDEDNPVPGEVQHRTGETPDSLAHKVHQLEYAYYPKVIRDLIIQGAASIGKE
jgi:phosphoribosylglycinamide formyltransferase-1